MIYAQVEIPMYQLHVVFCGDCEPHDVVEELAKRHKHVLGVFEQTNTNALGRCWVHDGDVYIWVKDMGMGGAFLHEMVHAACGIMDLKGIPLCSETEEVLAYLVGYLKVALLDEVYAEREKIECD